MAEPQVLSTPAEASGPLDCSIAAGEGGKARPDRRWREARGRQALECPLALYGVGAEPYEPSACLLPAMPRFYLHIRDGDTILNDPDGFEAASLEDAKSEAIASAREIIAERVLAGQIVDGQ